jgi:ABC-2 type transport system permease protein
MISFTRAFNLLFIRALKQSTRPIAALLPSFFMPFFFFVVNSAGFRSVARLPGFTGGNYLAFYAPVALLMSVFFTSGDAGFEMMLDITSGYFEKLLLTPVPRYALLLPRIAAMAVRAVVQAIIMLLLLLVFGAPYRAGFVGTLLLMGLVAIFAMGWSGIGLTLAALSRNPRVLQSTFVLTFPLTFITTAQLPLNLLSGWYRVAVLLNPITYILEGSRSIMVSGMDPAKVITAYVVAIGFLAVTSTTSVFAFRKISH